LYGLSLTVRALTTQFVYFVIIISFALVCERQRQPVVEFCSFVVILTDYKN